MKRIFDVIISGTLLIFLAPLMAALALAVLFTSRGPVLYRGQRVGLNGIPFQMLKFRTMVAGADLIGGPSSSSDDPRITKLGVFLRRAKLDELPQLFNVLLGEMSLVGPRPEVPAEVAEFPNEYGQILTVRPGITDHASIRFRNEGELLRGTADPHAAYKRLIQPEKLRLGVHYAENHTFVGDLGIIALTLRAVIFE